MTLMTDPEFDTFFETYAKNVEQFSQSHYWRLSDELIKELARRHLGLTAGSALLDAGGGTGKWARWAAEEFGATVTVADKSAHMLAEAKRLLAGSQSMVTLLRSDLHDGAGLADSSFDAVLSTYGVLSFLEDPAAVFRTLFRVLKPGACGLLMSHSLANALHSKINRDGASPEELTELMRTRLVRWADHVPQLRVFSAADLRTLARAAGFDVPSVFGVTCLTHPGAEDFGYPYAEQSEISQKLADEAYFATALRLELDAAENHDWAERAVNLMVKIRRPG